MNIQEAINEVSLWVSFFRSTNWLISPFRLRTNHVLQHENSLNELTGFYERAKVEANRRFLDGEIKRLRSKIEELKKSLDSSAKPVIRYKTISNYSWDQDQDAIKIYLNVKNFKDVKKELVKLELSDDNQAVTILVDNGGNSGRLVLKNLSHPLSIVQDPSGQVKITKNFVIVALKKADSKKWLSLQKTSGSSDLGLGKGLTGELGEKNEDPSQSMMKMMKNLYESGDDEMKKTIAKAWSEQQNKMPFM